MTYTFILGKLVILVEGNLQGSLADFLGAHLEDKLLLELRVDRVAMDTALGGGTLERVVDMIVVNAIGRGE